MKLRDLSFVITWAIVVLSLVIYSLILVAAIRSNAQQIADTSRRTLVTQIQTRNELLFTCLIVATDHKDITTPEVQECLQKLKDS